MFQKYKFLIALRYCLKQKDYVSAQKNYLKALYNGLTRHSKIEQELHKQFVISNRHNQSIKVAVACWDLSHNAAGRAVTLAELYEYAGFQQIHIVGCIIQNKKREKVIWEPLLSHRLPCRYFEIGNLEINKLLSKAVEFVIDNPFDVIHLSKPQITNIVLGFLYQLIWNTKVILDIDDEELAFINTKEDDLLQLYLNKITNYPQTIKDKFWTKVSVDLYHKFQAITVSNPALKEKYGGIIIPHVRNEKIFKPSIVLKMQSRLKFNIPCDAVVVLFFGTPKRHKGLLETAVVLSNMEHKNIQFVIIGDFPDVSLKKELQKISNVNYVFLPNQPYADIAKIVAMGDICILMQEQNNEIAKYQLPAKLIDALAMGLTIFLQKTPATENLIRSGYVYHVTENTLQQSLEYYLANRNLYKRYQQKQYLYFKKKFSMQVYCDKIHNLISGVGEQKENIEVVDFLIDIQNLNIRQFLKFCSDKIYDNTLF